MSSFAITLEDGIARFRLTRPQAANALDADFWSGFAPAIAALDRAGTARAIVLSGEGKHFCAGMDIAAFEAGGIFACDTPQYREAFAHVARDLQDAISALERLRIPVIAAIQGACVGAGLELAAACDLRFATLDARFRIEEINIGMMADLGSLQRLPKLLPPPVVAELAYLGTTLDATRAHALGFIAAPAPDAETCLAAALDAARHIASKAPLAIAGTKAALRYARDHAVDDGLNMAALLQASLWNPTDIAASIAARATRTTASHAPLAPIARLGG